VGIRTIDHGIGEEYGVCGFQKDKLKPKSYIKGIQAASEHRSSREAGEVFISLLSRVSLILTIVLSS
jgi:hypothetical protein